MGYSFGLPPAPVFKGYYALVGRTVASTFGFKVAVKNDKAIAEIAHEWAWGQVILGSPFTDQPLTTTRKVHLHGDLGDGLMALEVDRNAGP